MSWVQSISFEEMQQLYGCCDPSIVFHGTSSCYCAFIERQGFPLRWRPFKRKDISFLLSLSEECNLHHMQSIYLDVNHNVQDPNRKLGPYFTHILEGAVQYAEYTGGETIRCAFNRAGFLYENLKNVPERKTEIMKLRSLQSKWKSLIEDSRAVVYAIRATEREFPEIIPSQISAFKYQLREFGEICFRNGDFRSAADVPASAIIAKTVINR